MKTGKTLSDQIQNGDFIVTAEYLPKAETDGASMKSALQALQAVPSAVNVSDNPFGVAQSSLAASVLLAQSGIEPIFQVVTRDRNRIALQSDLLGAATLGIRNLLCLSGYHQSLTDSAESANVYDIDSTQLLAMVKAMTHKGELLNGARIGGSFSMTAGAVANPSLKPIELNMLRLAQKAESGAAFIQTQAVFNVEEFGQWLAAAQQAGIGATTAILAGVLPLESAEEAERLRNAYTEFQIPDSVVERLRSAGDGAAQKKEGLAICVETIQALKNMKGVRGIHVLSGGKEEIIPRLLGESGLSVKD
ncbi:MAG: methylenetetrahydrofolate reductase [Spirochaetes bacterium]|nr:methylenetetrahydrofolate reductase [Spirochaetota bacterium]